MKVKKRLLLLILFIMMVIGSSGCMSEEDSQNKLLDYLEDKYHEEFEVEAVVGNKKIFQSENGRDKIVAHPKGKAELVFVAGEADNEKKSLYDFYVLAKWGEELKTIFKNEIEKNLPPNSEFKVTMNARLSSYDKSMMNMPVLDYIKNINPDVTVMINVGIKTDRQSDINKYNQGLFNIHKLLKDLNTKYYTFTVGFVNEGGDISEHIRNTAVNTVVKL